MNGSGNGARSVRSPRRGALCSTVVMLAAGLLPATGLVGMAPAGAGARQFVYGTHMDSRPIEPYQNIPREINQGAPSTVVFLEDSGTPFCETISGVYDLGLIVDELATTVSPNNTYKNPTRVRATNPETSVPTKGEFGTRGGPYALAECPTATSGTGSGTWGGYVTEQLSVESASTKATSVRDPNRDVVVTEGLAKLQGIKLGPASIRSFESWLKVEWYPDREPLVSYHTVIQGVFNGADELVTSGGKGIVLSGSNVAGSDFAKQFNEQAKAHGSDLKALGTFGFRLVEPRYFKDPDPPKRDTIQAAVLDASIGFTAREGGIGHNQGFRLGLVNIAGKVLYVE